MIRNHICMIDAAGGNRTLKILGRNHPILNRAR